MPGTAAGAKKAWQKRKALEAQQKHFRNLVNRARRESMRLAERDSGFVGGLDINLQRIQEDPNPKLKDLKGRLSVFELMGNDAQIAAQLRGNILPLISAVRWTVEGGTPEMRDLVEQNLLRRGKPQFWCETSWTQRLFEKLQCLHYGFALHGKTWDVVDGYRILRRLTYLHPKSLGGPLGPWEWDKSGTRLVAVHRAYRKPDNSQEIDERIPIEEIDAAVWWMTGENWEGKALIRSMYGAFTKKDIGSKVAIIALLNGGVGIPMATLGPNDGKSDQTALTTIAKDTRQGSKERQFIVLKNGQKMEFLTTAGQIVDARPIIDEQNMEIAAAGSRLHMQVGQTASGSRAGGSIMTVSDLQDLEATKLIMQEQINHGAGYLNGQVEEVIYNNWAPETVKECPQIVGSHVSPSDQLDNVPNIGDAVQKGSITHDLSVENHCRKALGVKELSQPELDKLKKEAQPKDLGGRPDGVTPIDRNEPRDDDLGRAVGLAQKKTPGGGSRPSSRVASWPWLRSSPA